MSAFEWFFYIGAGVVCSVALGMMVKYGNKRQFSLLYLPAVDQKAFKFVVLECIILAIYAVDIEATRVYSSAVLLMLYTLTVSFMGSILMLVFFGGAKVLLNEVASRDSAIGNLAKNIDTIEKVYLGTFISLNILSGFLTIGFESLRFYAISILNGLWVFIITDAGSFLTLFKVHKSLQFQRKHALSHSDVDLNFKRLKYLRDKLLICSIVIFLVSCFIAAFGIQQIIKNWNSPLIEINTDSIPEFTMLFTNIGILFIEVVQIITIQKEKQRLDAQKKLKDLDVIQKKNQSDADTVLSSDEERKQNFQSPRPSNIESVPRSSGPSSI
jgi:hypothetical protein